MSQLIALKNGITYGPVNSRRLGRSLGINLMPVNRKWCSLDCLYCQYGWTTIQADCAAIPEQWPTVAEVASAVAGALAQLPEPPAFLTFSGHGEPTLHPAFAGMVDALTDVRNRVAPHAKTALLSNSSRVGEAAIRSAIARLDQPIMKLDAGDEAMFQRFNRPQPGIRYDVIVAGLKDMRQITLQALFTSGEKGNLTSTHTAQWIERVTEINPQQVQIYTLSRPFPSAEIVPAAPHELQQMCQRLSDCGIAATVF